MSKEEKRIKELESCLFKFKVFFDDDDMDIDSEQFKLWSEAHKLLKNK